MTEFSELRARAGFGLADLAMEFEVPGEVAHAWEAGNSPAPERVLRTLASMVPRPPREPKRYTAVSLFSGAMGFDLGLETTGRFEFLACVEKERSICDTIRSNKAAGRLNPGLVVFEEDISVLDPAAVLRAIGLNPGELDVLVGGPPCQAFSTAGRRGSTQDPRGTLLWDFLRFVEYMKPRMFLMENVRGLLSAGLKHRPIADRPERGGVALDNDEEPGSVVRLLAEDLRQLDGCSYHMDAFEVNAVNYGAPQLRERVLFIGNRFNAQIDFPDPTHGPAASSPDAGATLFGMPTPLKQWRTLGDAIGALRDDAGEIMDFSPRKKAFLELVPEGSNWRSLPVEKQRESMGRAWHAKGGRSGWWRRLSFDLPCPTLMTMPNHASTALCHPTEVRALTLREYAAVQEFPPDWTFSGTTTQRYAQVGNAVPVRLGLVAGGVIADALDRHSANENLPPAPPGFRVIYIQSHVRTRQWFKRGETFVWDDGGDNAASNYKAPVTGRRSRAIGRVQGRSGQP